MSCEIEIRKGTIHLRGEMTIYAAASLKDPLFSALASQAKQCRLDLSEVSELDTAGLQLLLMAKRLCAARDLELRVVEPSAAVRAVMELLRIEDLGAAPSASVAASSAAAGA